MIIVLNGPPSIGKSTLAEALTERIANCAMLEGDHVIALNPPPDAEISYLNATVPLLYAHHRTHGYRHVVIDHIWRTPAELTDLRRRLHEVDEHVDIRCFLLTLPVAENARRIERRQQARALDEREFERQTVAEERRALQALADDRDWTPFDVSAAPDVLVDAMLRLLGLD